MKKLDPSHITIVGLGLIGGSLAGAARKAFPRARIVGVSRNRRALVKAKKRGWIHEGYTELKQAFQNRHGGRAQGPPLHLVILCTPVDTLKDFLKRLDRMAPEGTLVTDAGSVKGFLVRWARQRKWRRIQFVGAHPMAGSHERGIDHARPDLFKHALTFVTPGPGAKTVIHFWKKISRKVVVISPERHDRIAAEISHLPHLLASLVVDSTQASSLSFAASGFLDTTRVAASDPGLWVPIVGENRREIMRALGVFEKRLARAKKILQRKDLGSLRQIFRRSQKRRASLE